MKCNQIKHICGNSYILLENFKIKGNNGTKYGTISSTTDQVKIVQTNPLKNLK